MQSFWTQWVSFSQSPFALFALLLFLSYGIYYRYFRFIPPVAASGSIVMALGVFALTCLPQFHISEGWLLVCALLLLIIWLYIAMRLLQRYLRDEFVWRSFTDRLSMGTWVAATVLVVLFVDQVEPTLHGFIVFLGLFAVVIYLVYWREIFLFARLCVRKRFCMPVKGSLLLIVIATQAIVLLCNELFLGDLPLYFYQTLILMGLLFYVGSVTLIARYFLSARYASWIVAWPNTNHIIYGALAITGVAALRTQAFSFASLTLLWWLAFGLISVFLLLDLLRLIIRINIKGWRKAIFVYDTSQWARNFTVGMFYTFTFEYYHEFYPASEIVEVIAHYGQYPVTLLLIMEIVIAWSFVIYVSPRGESEA